MSDACAGKRRAQLIEHHLIGDLAGEPYVPRVESAGRAAHERTAPVRGGAGDVRNAVRAGARQELLGRLRRTREHQRATRQHRAQIDLQAAVAADVVERAPDRVRVRRLAGQESRETRQAMGHELGSTGRAGSQQNPLARRDLAPLARGRHRAALQAPQAMDGPGRAGMVHRTVRQGEIRIRARGDLRQALRTQVGRTQHQAARDAVELEQRKRRAHLLAQRQQYGAAAEGLAFDAEAGACLELGERHRAAGGVQGPFEARACACDGIPQGCHHASLAISVVLAKEAGVDRIRVRRRVPR